MRKGNGQVLHSIGTSEFFIAIHLWRVGNDPIAWVHLANADDWLRGDETGVWLHCKLSILMKRVINWYKWEIVIMIGYFGLKLEITHFCEILFCNGQLFFFLLRNFRRNITVDTKMRDIWDSPLSLQSLGKALNFFLCYYQNKISNIKPPQTVNNNLGTSYS